jgi:hypothetical protein
MAITDQNWVPRKAEPRSAKNSAALLTRRLTDYYGDHLRRVGWAMNRTDAPLKTGQNCLSALSRTLAAAARPTTGRARPVKAKTKRSFSRQRLFERTGY